MENGRKQNVSVGKVARHKVAMIGVDAAELSYIREHISSLPNFTRALERGTIAQLTSQAALIPHRLFGEESLIARRDRCACRGRWD